MPPKNIGHPWVKDNTKDSPQTQTDSPEVTVPLPRHLSLGLGRRTQENLAAQDMASLKDSNKNKTVVAEVSLTCGKLSNLSPGWIKTRSQIWLIFKMITTLYSST